MIGGIQTHITITSECIRCGIDDKHEVFIVEPQNDSVFEMPDDWNAYLVMI